MTMPDDLELMKQHVEALFTHDERTGRMLRVNEPGGFEAPRFFLGRTAEGVLLRFRADLPDEIVRSLESLSRTESNDISTREPVHADEYRKILESHSPLSGVWLEQAFVFPDESRANSPTRVVRIGEENSDILRGGFEDWIAEAALRQPFVAVVEDGRAVSVCASVRITPRAHECGIETLPEHRGRGHAVEAAAVWAELVRGELGAPTPLYSTFWDNTASQRVAAKLGCGRFGSDFYIS